MFNSVYICIMFTWQKQSKNKKQSKKPGKRRRIVKSKIMILGKQMSRSFGFIWCHFSMKKRFFNVTFYIKRSFREWKWHKRSAQSWVGDCKLTGNEASARLKANESGLGLKMRFFPESESGERWHDRNVQSWGGGDCKLAR